MNNNVTDNINQQLEDAGNSPYENPLLFHSKDFLSTVHFKKEMIQELQEVKDSRKENELIGLA